MKKTEKPADPVPQPSVTKPAPPQVAADTDPAEEPRADIPVTRRRLPRLNELLPPATWLPSEDQEVSRDGPIRLDTREPRYFSYFEHVKRAIEVVWEYPENALTYGAEGKLWLEFTILSNGTLEGPHLLRSSGFSELDEEAMRAVRAAAPFRPIPNHIGRRRLDIVATFEYHNNRLRYDFLR